MSQIKEALTISLKIKKSRCRYWIKSKTAQFLGWFYIAMNYMGLVGRAGLEPATP